MKKMIKIMGLLLCGLLSLSVLFGCQPTNGGDDDTGFIVLRFWNGFTGTDGETMDRIVEHFNEEYEEQEIKVVADKIPWDTLFTKLTTTSSNLGSAPHIVAMSASRIAGMNLRKIFLPMDDIEEYLGVTEDEYLEPAWNGGILNGTRLGFPIDVHPTAMYYNKNLISEDELPTTWERFKTVCKGKTKDGVYGWACPSMYSITKDVFITMLYSAGGTLFDASHNPIFDNDLAVSKLTYLYDLVHTDKISPKDVGAGGDYTLFTQGKSVFYFDGPWVINTFGLLDENNESNIGVAPMPETTGTYKNFAGSHQFTLMKNTVTSPRIKEACYTFMRYVNEHSLDWAKAGQVPALKAIHDTDEYKALEPLQAFTEMAKTSVLGEIEYEYWYEAYNGMGVGVSNAISAIKSPANALKDAVSEFKGFVADEQV